MTILHALFPLLVAIFYLGLLFVMPPLPTRLLARLALANFLPLLLQLVVILVVVVVVLLLGVFLFLFRGILVPRHSVVVIVRFLLGQLEALDAGELVAAYILVRVQNRLEIVVLLVFQIPIVVVHHLGRIIGIRSLIHFVVIRLVRKGDLPLHPTFVLAIERSLHASVRARWRE